ncbi:MAG: hypothetical protein WAJ93_02685, partial [Candidatus Nitrosopolaris sp.]
NLEDGAKMTFAMTLDLVSNDPIYLARGWTISLTKLKSAGFPQQVESIFENGTMEGVGKVTNLETWIFSPIDALGFGHGVITTKDKQMVTWTGHDISGTKNEDGTATYRGLVIFKDTNSSSKVAFLNNLEGSYITEVNGNNQTTKMWELK